MHLSLANCPIGDGGLESEFKSHLTLVLSGRFHVSLHAMLIPICTFILLLLHVLIQTLVQSQVYHETLAC